MTSRNQLAEVHSEPPKIRTSRNKRSIPRRHHLDWFAQLHCEPLEHRRLLAVLTVTSELDNIIPNDGLVTLREAITAANSDSTTELGESGSGADWIVFDRSLDGKSIVLSIAGLDEDAAQTGDLDITDSAGLRIIGNGPKETIIDARAIDRVFDIPGTSGQFLFEHLTITGGSTTDGGGAIRSLFSAEVTIIGSTIFGNVADGSGGGIQTRAERSYADGNITIINSTISGNSSGNRGGGIATGGGHDGGNVKIRNSTISGNTASGNGGGIYTGGYTGAEVTVSNSTISGNSAGGNAGGIGARNVTVTHSMISGNVAAGGGGGIFTSFGNVTVSNSVISDNSAADSGGGIFASDIFNLGASRGNVTLSDSVVSGNSSGSDGGGISALYHVTVRNSTISGNSTDGVNVGGGGISARGGATIENSSISDNASNGQHGHGGGISVFGNVAVSNTTVSGNSARFGDGGGISAIGDFGDVLILSNSTLSGNSGDYGGGLFISADADIENSTISGNTAKFDGGGLFLSAGNLTISSSIVAKNTAAGQSPPVPLPRPVEAHDAFTSSGYTITVLYSLIGDNTSTSLTEAQAPDANGNLIGTSAAPIDPLLEPLHENGGPTLTLALLPGSPAIDAGKNEFPIDIRGSLVYFDQRGESFSRLVGDRADVGAFEVQASAEALLGDLDLDGTVAFADFLILTANFGNNDVAREGGDLNDDGAVSLADFLILSANFGKQRPTAEPMSGSKIAVGVLATDKFFSQGGGELMVSERLAGVVF